MRNKMPLKNHIFVELKNFNINKYGFGLFIYIIMSCENY